MSCVFDLFFCVKERDLVIRTRDTRLRPITRSSCVCDSCIYVKGRDILLTQDIHLRLWRPCLLTDRDEMSNLHRRPSIIASYQVSVHLAKKF